MSCSRSIRASGARCRWRSPPARTFPAMLHEPPPAGRRAAGGAYPRRTGPVRPVRRILPPRRPHRGCRRRRGPAPGRRRRPAASLPRCCAPPRSIPGPRTIPSRSSQERRAVVARLAARRRGGCPAGAASRACASTASAPRRSARSAPGRCGCWWSATPISAAARSPSGCCASGSGRPGGLKIESAGTLPIEDRAPPAEAIEAAARFGVDLSRHRSTQPDVRRLARRQRGDRVRPCHRAAAARHRAELDAPVLRLPDLTDARDIVEAGGGGLARGWSTSSGGSANPSPRWPARSSTPLPVV